MTRQEHDISKSFDPTTESSEKNENFDDEYADPIGLTDKYYTEELFRLPNSFLCYTPLV